ncbi:MAG: hypothetical protein FJ096_05675 [Deltaproteobacteria bacterium]|nr:hypothetical protein [Deltaproteobacteria bacterium]
MTESNGNPPGTKPPESLGVMFDCCNVYVRIWKRRDGAAYEGRCPRCLRVVRIAVGPGGSSSRIWRAT